MLLLDYISVTINLRSKDILFLGYCKKVAIYSSGWVRYELAGCNKLQLYLNETARMLKIEGSLPYYYQGHNFSFTQENFALSIRDIETLLNISIATAEIHSLEYGVIFEVDRKPVDYFKHHFPAKSRNNHKLIPKPAEKSMLWEDGKSGALKMYDAGFNIKCKQDSKMQKIIKAAGWNPKKNYIKWEVHTNKPENLIKGKVLWLADLFRDSVQDAMKEDLLFQYQRLKPMKTIELPSSKNNLHADLIALHYAVELGMNVEKSEEEIKLELYANIDSLPLSKKDKENRKARIRLLLSRLKEEAVSKWDLYDKIKEAIEAAPPVEDLP